MSAWHDALRRLGLPLVLLTLTLACSRPKDDSAPVPSVATRAPVQAPPAQAPLSASPPATPTPALPTPEDMEEDSAHRITEQNLESELDRLEREIQAE